jgi:ATPase family AAA domain-containing protein 3A/B
VREAAKLVAQQVEKRLGRPSLVRETSRRTGLPALAAWLRAKLWPFGGGSSGAHAAGAAGVAHLRRQLGDVILQAELKARVESLAVSVANARRHGAPFRHLMLYGPPGTGKTMVAKRLARGSGLDYAIMSGGDVGPLGSDAVTQLHALFAWAAASPRGLLLFIDEAEAFLASRSRRAMSEAQRNALNALLFQTGEQSSSFMMVLATNRPGDLDTAVTDRVDEAFSFPLPGRAERAAMLRLYFHTYITATRRHGGGLWAHLRHSRLLFGPFARVHSGIEVDGFAPPTLAPAKGGGGGTAAVAAAAAAAAAVPDELFVALAHELDGFSGREIAKLMISVQGAAYGSAAGRLTREMLLRVVQWKVQEHRAKGRMAKAGAAGLSY